MPLSPIAELVLRPIFEIVVQGAWYVTGVVAVRAGTFGAWQVEDIGRESRRRGNKASLPPRTVSAQGAIFIGLATWVVIGGACYLFWWLSSS